jgi:hypothetical protein
MDSFREAFMNELEKQARVLTEEAREKIPKSETGLPEEREKGKGAVEGSYPMPDKQHAKTALGFAKMNLRKGKLSQEEYDRIAAKAHAVLGDAG